MENPSWQPQAVESADLAAGLRAAAQLQVLPVPPALGKQVANYILRVGKELESRGGASPEAQATK
jgi:hypothetical protein